MRLRKDEVALRIVFLVSLLAMTPLITGRGSADPPPEVAGVIGLTPVETNSCVAMWVPIPEDKALSGILWYNNDEQVVFPEILLESGSADYPVSLQACQLVAENVQGVSSDWSNVQFSTPAACLSEGLYVLFRFPEGSEYTADGAGGGAALGYSTTGDGLAGWISVDGEDWVPFTGDFGFAAQPEFIDAADATIIMQGAELGDNNLYRPALVTALHPAYPNPFNPQTCLKFSLASDGFVELTVYNIRGERVRRLVEEPYPAGIHEVLWPGLDDSGRSVASGVYFARMTAGSVVMSQRLVLVR